MKNKSILVILLSIITFTIHGQSKLNGSIEIEILFKDSILNKDYGSFMTKPSYKSENSDTLLYELKTQNLFLPYSSENSYKISYQLIKSKKENNLRQTLQGKEKFYTYKEKLPLELFFNINRKEVYLDNYVLSYNDVDSFLYFYNKKILVANFSVGDSLYHLCFNPHVGNLSQDFFIANSYSKPFRIGDVFEIKNSFFKVTKFDYFNKSAVIEQVVDSSKNNIGFEIGKRLRNFNEYKNIVDANEFSKKPIESNRAYLFYFWGEWCLPCVKKINKNKNLFSRIDKSKINIVNVAAILPKENCKAKTIELINSKEIPYYHLLDDSSLLINQLRISTYPTYLVVSKYGEILYKDSMQYPVDVQKFMMIMKNNGFLN